MNAEIKAKEFYEKYIQSGEYSKKYMLNAISNLILESELNGMERALGKISTLKDKIKRTVKTRSYAESQLEKDIDRLQYLNDKP